MQPVRLASVFVDEPLVGLPLQVGEGASVSDDAEERNVRHGVGVDQINGDWPPARRSPHSWVRASCGKAPVPRFHSIAAR